MKVETKIRQAISHRKSPLVFRSDVASLGSRTQVTCALKQLIASGELRRIAQGIYMKSQADVSFECLVKEIVAKLHLELSLPEQDYNSLFLSYDTVVVEVEKPRVDRTVEFNGKQILFRNSMHDNSHLSIPKTNVARFVKDLAKRYKVSYRTSALDIFGDAVTRLAGDTVAQDDIRDLIIALKRAGKITARQLISLNTNYLHEKRQHVRSI